MRSSGQRSLDGVHDGGILRLHLGPETRDDLAGARDEELLEVPGDVARSAVGIGCRRQLLINGMTVVPVHVDLLEEREAHPIRGGAELLDLLWCSRLLSHELVAREANNGESTVGVGLLQALQSLVLRSQAALGCHVDDEERLPGILAERRLLTVQCVDGDVVKSHAAEDTGHSMLTPPGKAQNHVERVIRVKSMYAVVIRDSQLHWEERETPVPGDTELLVAVHAAGLNGADIMQRRGNYPAPPGTPADIPGMELAGEVIAVGSQVRQHVVGDRVMGLVGGGAQATMAVIDESHALAVPDALSWAEAGGFPEVFSTAFDAMFTHAGLAMGERVLISGAAGGVGTAAVQLAAAAGASVVATVRDATRHGEVALLGAGTVIDPADVAAHGPYDVVLELVGAASLPPSSRTWPSVPVSW